MAGSRQFSLKGPDSGNRYFINEQGPRPGIIHIWVLYFNTLFNSQNPSVKPKQPNILLQKVSLLSFLQLERYVFQFQTSFNTLINHKRSFKHNKKPSRAKEYNFLLKLGITNIQLIYACEKPLYSLLCFQQAQIKIIFKIHDGGLIL